jgi:endonuclease/exonuclease/phosphatase (EEP) superfamily protein YafD
MLRETRGAITALALVACLVALAVGYDLGIPGQALLQSLRFHIAAVVGLLSVLLFATGAWWRGVLFLVVAGASAGQGLLIVSNQQDTRIEAAAYGTRPLFRLLSFNMLNTNPNGKAIADLIVESGADVVMLMEAWPVLDQKARIFAAYPYRAGCEDWCETIILSKTPLTAGKASSLGPIWRNRLITAVTEIGGTGVHLMLAHMVKPYFDDLASSESMVLQQAIQDIDGPLLLAGDFNAAAWSDNVARVARWRGLAPGPAYPPTWPVALGPLGVPIDNVFTRPPLVITDIRAIDDALGSNHRGLVAEVALAAGS